MEVIESFVNTVGESQEKEHKIKAEIPISSWITD
jgi:hypothetical protein